MTVLSLLFMSKIDKTNIKFIFRLQLSGRSREQRRRQEEMERTARMTPRELWV